MKLTIKWVFLDDTLCLSSKCVFSDSHCGLEGEYLRRSVTLTGYQGHGSPEYDSNDQERCCDEQRCQKSRSFLSTFELDSGEEGVSERGLVSFTVVIKNTSSWSVSLNTLKVKSP